jgi:RHS repeat-associated protein
MEERGVMLMKSLTYLPFFLLLASLSASTAPGASDDSAQSHLALAFPANPSAEDISRARVFDESLVPVGGVPGATENTALARALVEYSRRATVDDFSSLTEFLQRHPRSAWKAALLTCLGLEYYKAAYYSRSLEAWCEAWALGQNATNLQGKFLADRAVCELAGLYSRLGHMNDLEALLKSVEQRVFIGGATERISLAREALWMMQNKPGVSFRCGPLALQRILLSDQSLLASAATNAMMAIFNSASTQQGFSLPQVAELSKQIGLNYQMAYREKTGDFAVPSVVHWKAGHYAAMVERDGDRYLLEDPTFANSVWATKRALEAETSGYFLIPAGRLPSGWRKVNAKEGAAIWGKGVTSGNDPDNYTCNDLQTGSCGGSDCGMGMPVSSVHMMLANLQIRDTPVGYTPPFGPAVPFTLRYNHRDYLYVSQPGGISVSINFGPRWSYDWNGRIRDNPNNPRADVKYFVGGGGALTFTGFDPITQTFAPQQYEHTQLKRIGTNTFTSTYEMLLPDGSKRIFGRRIGASYIDVLLTQVVDPAGNAVTLTYSDTDNRLLAIIDALGQVTTISYDDPQNSYLISKVTDPFGRFATFEYTTFNILCGPDPDHPMVCPIHILSKITDVVGLVSRFEYIQDSMQRMITPYGTNSFTFGNGPETNRTMRFVETQYADGSRDRVEFNQSDQLGIPSQEPNSAVPQNMAVFNTFLYARNTYYWDRNACATAYGDYGKARIYHWLHAANISTTSGILESVKKPLERRVWFDYDGQGISIVGRTDKPTHIGRVLDDGTTQLYTYFYNTFGKVTNYVDPLGRRLSFIYDTNGIDLVEIRQTRAGNNERLFKAAYNPQHRPLSTVDAAGQTNVYTYNSRGQLLTRTNPRNETTTYTYDSEGYLVTVDGPLPGTNDLVSATYDAFGRLRTTTDVSGYTRTNSYDALNRLSQVVYPDSTFTRYTYNRLDLVSVLDRAGRETRFEYDNVGQLSKVTDPLGRETLLSWCRCGALRTLIDPMGRATEWQSDIQGRVIAKQYSDGSKISYLYENSISRLRQVIDEKQQVKQYAYNRDNTIKSVAYANGGVPTSGVNYTYDPDYARVISMVDALGTTLYSYNPITLTATLGAGRLASVDGPLPNDTIAFSYDELGRRVSTAINGVSSITSYDAAGRVAAKTNALGGFTYHFDGASGRLLSRLLPNAQIEERSYGNNIKDRVLERIKHRAGATPISEFAYGHDNPARRITTWSQQAGNESPLVHSFGYDDVDQLLSANVTRAGAPVTTFAYTYDPNGNRLTENTGPTNYAATYNVLNQLSTGTAAGTSRSNEWDAADRLVAVTDGSRRTEFTYDGQGRRVAIRQLLSGSDVSYRRFVWCGLRLCEERDATGAVVKRFFPQGVKIEAGTNAGSYFYTRDHLGSIRELTDSSSNVRARYVYDPYGRRAKLAGDVEADFGFAGMFWSPEVKLSLTHFRAYDAELGRWISRDPLPIAEVRQGPNLYAYVRNDPVNRVDPLGLCDDTVTCTCLRDPHVCAAIEMTEGAAGGGAAGGGGAGGGTAIAGAGAAAGGVLAAGEGPPPMGPRPLTPLSCPRSPIAVEPIVSPRALTAAESSPGLSEGGPAPRPSNYTGPSSYAPTEFEPPPLAETQHAPEGWKMGNGEYTAWRWLEDELRDLHSSPGYGLLTPEHTQELVLGVIERFDQMLELARARVQIEEWLSGLDL